MSPGASLRIDVRGPNAVCIAVSPGDTLQHAEMAERTYEDPKMIAPMGDFTRSVYGITDILNGESLLSLRIHDGQKKLRFKPHSEDATLLQIENATNGNIELAVPIGTLGVCEELLSAARSYYEHHCLEDDETAGDSCDCVELGAGINDADRRIAYYREHETLDGYEPSISEDLLTGVDPDCVLRARLRDLLLESSDLDPFVRSLTEHSDDEFVTECYFKLLGFNRELSERTAAVLADHPDERARKGLSGALWSDHASPAVVEALRRIMDGAAVKSMGSMIRSGSREPLDVRLAAADALAEITIEDYLDEDEREQLCSELADGYETTEDPNLQSKLEDLQADLS